MVDAPVSSMKTRQAGSRLGWTARQASLELATSGRFRSLARAAFLNVCAWRSKAGQIVFGAKRLPGFRYKCSAISDRVIQPLAAISASPSQRKPRSVPSACRCLRARREASRPGTRRIPLHHRRGRRTEMLRRRAAVHPTRNWANRPSAKIIKPRHCHAGYERTSDAPSRSGQQSVSPCLFARRRSRSGGIGTIRVDFNDGATIARGQGGGHRTPSTRSIHRVSDAGRGKHARASLAQSLAKDNKPEAKSLI